MIDLNLKAVSQPGGRRSSFAEGGKIINIASMLVSGRDPRPSYTASKSGVLGLTRLLANEWAGAVSTSTP